MKAINGKFSLAARVSKKERVLEKRCHLNNFKIIEPGHNKIAKCDIIEPNEVGNFHDLEISFINSLTTSKTKWFISQIALPGTIV